MHRIAAVLFLAFQSLPVAAHLKATPEECEKLYGKVEFTRPVDGGIVRGYQPKRPDLEGVVVMAEFREGVVASIHYEISGKEKFTRGQFSLISSLNGLAMKSTFVEVGPTPGGAKRLWVTEDSSAHMLVALHEASVDLITKAAAIDVIKKMPPGKLNVPGEESKPPVPAAESTGPPTGYTKVHLPRRMTIDIPKAWRLRDNEEKIVTSSAGHRKLDLTALETPSGVETTLLSARSTPQTTYAFALIVCRVPAIASSDQLLNTDKQTLKETAREMHAEMARQLSSTPDTLVEPSKCAIEMVGDCPALLFQYRRSGSKGDVLVFDYQIARPDATFELMVSYRASEAQFWENEIRHVLGSVRFDEEGKSK